MDKTLKDFLICCFFLLFSTLIYSAEEKKGTSNPPPHVLYTIPSDKFRLEKKLSRPTGVTVFNGDIYISDSLNNRIVAFNDMGELLFIIGKKGSGQCEFQTPSGIIADEENIYVVDTYNSRIQILDRKYGDYKYEINFREKVSEEDQDKKKLEKEEPAEKKIGGEELVVQKSVPVPIDFEMDTKGKIYVTFKRNSTVRVYDKKGNFKYKFGKPGQNDGEFSIATSIAANNITSEVETKIYIVDTMNYRVQIFNESGKFLNKFGRHSDEMDGFLMPSLISLDNNSRVYVYDRAKGKILVYDKDRKYLFYFGRSEKLAFAEDLFIDRDNTIYVADTLNNRIVVYGY